MARRKITARKSVRTIDDFHLLEQYVHERNGQVTNVQANSHGLLVTFLI